MLLNPIVDWTDEDVWNFLGNIVNVQHCNLYDEGFKRIWCIGCPMAGGETKAGICAIPEIPRTIYVRAFDRMIANRKEKRHGDWRNGEEVMRWWLKEEADNV